MGAEIQFVLVPRAYEPLIRSRYLRRINQPVVLKKSCKHATEHPCCSNLRDVISAPLLVTLGRAFSLLCFLVFGLECLPHLWHFTGYAAFQQIGFELSQ